MSELLLKVEETFVIAGRAIALVPDIPIERNLPHLPVTVTLKRPDGSSVTAEASFHVPHIQFAKVEDLLEHLKREQKYVCLLKGVKESEVPIGTEVWLD